MNNYFKFLYQQLLLIIVVICTFVGISIMPAYYNTNYEYYEITFKYETEVDTSKLKDIDYINDIKNIINLERLESRYVYLGDKKVIIGNNDLTINEGVVIYDGISYSDWDGNYYYSYSSFDYVNTKKLNKSIRVSNNDDGIHLKCSAAIFNSWQQARRFLSRMASDLDSSDCLFKIGENYVLSDSSKVIEKSIVCHGFISIYPYMIIGASIGLVLIIGTLTIIYFIKKDSLINKLEFDNIEVFRTPFSINYIKKAFSELKNVKNLAMMSIMLAMMLVCKLIPLPSGFGNMGISLGFIFYAVACTIYGPICGMIIGFLSDTLGFFLFPDGYPFHLGYTLNAMLPGLIYGTLLYRTKITGTKCFLARLIVNIFVNAILGSIWWGQVAEFDKSATITYFFTLSLPKNIVYLVPQSIVLFLVLKTLSRIFKQTNMIPESICDNITII